MRADPALTQALRIRWDSEATTFVFSWGHMIPSLEDVSRIMGLRIYERAESLGLFDVGKVAGESDDEHLDRLTRVSRRELASEPGAQADLDLRHFLVLFHGRLLFATRGDAIHCRFLPLLENLSEVGGYAWGASFLAHQFHSLGASERQTSTSGFFPFLQVWAYLHLPVLRRGEHARPGLVPIARRWGLIRDSRSLGDQLDFRGLHNTTDWCERAKEQFDNWKCRGKAVKSDPTTDDAYLQAYALKYGSKVYKSARHQDDVTGEIASLRALLYLEVQDREAAQRQTAELRVRSIGAGGASSSRGAGDSSSLLEARLAGAVLRAEEAQRHLEEWGQIQTTQSERDQLRIRAEAAEAQVTEATRELAALWVQGPPSDQAEMVRLRTKVMAQRIRIDELRGMVMTLGEAARSRSRTGVSGASGTSVRQYLADSSSRQRNEDDERRHRGEGSTQGDRDG
ncbi:hypothetical protein Taro_037135, partial [Colocasia esculenta]|nr:hypothetical protein [Colocasia esculenta]